VPGGAHVARRPLAIDTGRRARRLAGVGRATQDEARQQTARGGVMYPARPHRL
jgi:hypothetical protein